MCCVGLPNSPGGEGNLVSSVRLNVVHPVGSNFLFCFKQIKWQKWGPITIHTPSSLLAMSKDLVRILEYSNKETKRAWQSHESWLRPITTVFNWNRISFSRLGWRPGQRILKEGPSKGGNNKLQWAGQRFKTTHLCLLILRGSSASSLHAAKEATLLSGLWPPGHPFSFRRRLMFIMVLVIMGWMRWAAAAAAL